MGAARFSEQFLEHLQARFEARSNSDANDGSRAAYADLDDLEHRLDQALSQARKAHPKIAVDDASFISHLARHLSGYEPHDGFEHLRAADLMLALGCAKGVRAALATFETVHGPDVETALRRFRNVPMAEDDMRQALHEKLFVGRQNREPKIADYAGQGFLQNWVRITAVRTFTDIARAAGRNKEDPEEDLMQLADGEDLELSFLKQHYRSEFKQSFEHALGQLEPGERNLLRHSVVRGQSIDQIAGLYHVHRATAARRVAKARDALLSHTRQSLMDRLSIGRDEFDSLMQLIASRIDLSINRVLGSQAENESSGADD